MSDDLEKLIGERLRRLPSPDAPRSLRPRVMAVVASRRREPVSSPWFQWPWPRQAAFVAAQLLAVAGGAWLLSQWTMPSLGAASGWSLRIADAQHTMVAVASAVQAIGVFVRTLLSQPIVMGFAAVVIVMSAACGGFAMMLGRVAAASVQGAE